MSRLLLWCGTARLVALLWAVTGCVAASQQLQPPADGNSDLNATLEQLWAFVGQAVRSATEPLVTTLDSRLDRLDSTLDGLVTRLDNQDHKLDGLATRMDNQDSKLDTRMNNQDSKLDGLATRMDNQDSKLDTRMDNQDSKLDGMDSKLDGLVTRLDNQDSKLDNQDSKLDGLVTRLDNQDSKLDGLATQLDRVHTNLSTPAPLPRDCSDLPAGAQSGVHLLQPDLNRSVQVPAYCDLHKDGGSWTVIQRRADVQPRQDFFLGWQAYKDGFGELDAEFWWGLDNLRTLTSASDRQYELRVNLADFDGGRRHAVYQGFRISSEAEGFRLAATDYTGDAGDSLGYHVGQKFSTKDRDQDKHSGNCAVDRKGGWWYDKCTDSNLNGRYLSGESPGRDGVSWYEWRGSHYSLKTVEVMIRPA